MTKTPITLHQVSKFVLVLDKNFIYGSRQKTRNVFVLPMKMLENAYCPSHYLYAQLQYSINTKNFS